MGNVLRVDPGHSLNELVETALKRVFPLASQNIRWRVRDKRVCLTGSVQSYYEKQLAQETLLHMPDVEQVVNLLHVLR